MRLKNVKVLEDFKQLPAESALLLLRTDNVNTLKEFVNFLKFTNEQFETVLEAVQVFEATIRYRGQRVMVPFSYRQFFEAMIDLWGIDNIRDLTPEQRDDFFTFIELAWRAEDRATDEGDRGGDDRDLLANPPFTLEQLVDKVLELWGVTKEEFKNLPKEQQKDIITTIKTFWVFDQSLDDNDVTKILKESKNPKAEDLLEELASRLGYKLIKGDKNG